MPNEVICFGEVLWDDFGQTKTIGGAPLNVCYHLSKLNTPAVIVSGVGNDPLGTAIMAQMENWKIDYAYCRVSDRHPTSTVQVQLLKDGVVKYSITENVAWDFIGYDENLAKKIAEAGAFVYGTLASRSAVSQKTLLRYVKKAKWPVLDLNLRQPYMDKAVILPLIEACHSLKLNQDELEFITLFLKNTALNEGKSISAIFAAFVNIREIILTKGVAGAAYYSRKEHLDLPGLMVKVVDTVGSGDSFLAAFVGGKLSGKSNKQILREAITLSAFIATRQGGCPPYTVMELESFKNRYYE